MLKANKALALASGDITDRAKKTFRNITGLQYAVWALDWKMWTMLLPYLTPEAAKEQAQGFKTGSWVKDHAEHTNWDNLIEALQVYHRTNQPWFFVRSLVEQVCRAQFKLPIHVLQEYDNPNRPFNPCPDFTTEYSLQRSLPDWVEEFVSGCQSNFRVSNVLVRGKGPWLSGAVVAFGEIILMDLNALKVLYDKRIQQRGELVAQLNPLQAQKPAGK